MENALTVNRTADIIAAEINSIKSQTRSIVLFNSIEIGRRLVEAKSLIPHGEWGKWLEERVEYSKSTANNFMRIFEEYGAQQIALFGDNAKSQTLGNLTYTQAVALLGVPAEEREQFIQEHDIGNMSTRELQQAIKEREQALKEKQDLELQLKEAREKVIKNAQYYERAKNLAKELEKTKEQLSAAHSEDVEKDLKLDTAHKKIEELERKLKEPVTVDAALIEKIPEEVERELNELREKAKTLEEKAGQQNPAELKFRVHFDYLVKGFNDLLNVLYELPADTQDKYRKAVSKLISKMTERL